MQRPVDANPQESWRTVILRHDLPDGSSHFDWMFQPPAGFPHESSADGTRIPTFRCEIRLDLPGPNAAQVINRLADHREHYLAYQGPVSGDLGVVARMRDGIITGCQVFAADDGSGWDFVIEWRNGDDDVETQVLRLICGANDQWMVVSARQNPKGVSH
jgi:hypothetical protein